MNKKIILIIGGSKGIGEAIVRKSACAENIVVYTYLNSKDNAETMAKELMDSGFEAYCYLLNILNSKDVTAFVEDIGKRFGRIDVLVNNAGITRDNLVYLTGDDDWYDVINTNLTGVFFVCRAVSKYMIRNRSGKIINISSIAAAKGAKGQANYCAAKGGIEAMTRALAVELSKKHITVNCVSPGVIETDMTRNLIAQYRDVITGNILCSRVGKPQDIAEAVHFLISPAADYINGQVIHVDGGML